MPTTTMNGANGPSNTTPSERHRKDRKALPFDPFNADPIASGLRARKTARKHQEARESVDQAIEERCATQGDFRLKSACCRRSRASKVPRATALGYDVAAVFIATCRPANNDDDLKTRVADQSQGEASRTPIRRRRIDMVSKEGSRTLAAKNPLWRGLLAEDYKLSSFGVKLSGGGAHQSKTMMFRELEALIGSGASTPEELRTAAIDENVIGKATSSTRRLTLRHLASLYGLLNQPPLTRVLLQMWPSDVQGRRLRALLVALARDPLLRETAPAIMSGSVGQSLRYPRLQDGLLAAFPERFSEKMLQSLAQNCASSWTQSGHLKGAVKKLRQRVAPTPGTVAFAALIAAASGFGGPAILSSAWIRVLDLEPGQALDALRRAEATGLARVRSAGDVTEISVRQPMARALGVPELEYL